MSARVEWLPVGHVAHGYRRVFTVFEDDKLRHVVNLAHMPYELVFQVRELAGKDKVDDPSLWWGLSIIASLVANETLLAPENPETADDGYIQIRPQLPNVWEMISVEDYQEAKQVGYFALAMSGDINDSNTGVSAEGGM